MSSSLLAALAGALGGLGDGLQLNERMKRDREEADARRRAEALQQLVTRDQLGLVKAPQYQGTMGAMLRATPTPTDTGTSLDSVLAALKPAAGQIALQRERPETVAMQDPITKSMGQYLMDPTQSRGARERAADRTERMTDYTRQRSDTLADRDAGRAAGAATQQQGNEAAFRALGTLYPEHPAARQPYHPGTDYGFVADNVAKTAQQRALFTQQLTLERERTAGALRVANARTEASNGSPKYTEGELGASGYLSRAVTAHGQLDGIKGPNAMSRMAGDHSTLGQTDQFRQWNAVRKNFATAVLRKESGASISDGEFASVDAMYIPMPGDSPAVLDQKRKNREGELVTLQKMAGRAGGEALSFPSNSTTGSYHPDNPNR